MDAAVVIILYIALLVFWIIGMWKAFEKAGQPGWGAIIPIYNAYLITKIAGKEWWWLLLLLIPIVNIVVSILLGIGVAKNFGKSDAFGIGVGLLPFIFWMILGYGDARYQPTTTV